MKRRQARPKPRGDKRERTRRALIEAAGEVIARKGLERTALEDVARKAGMTRGAIYGNFRDKEELFLAVAATRWKPIIAAPAAGATLRARMRAHGEAVAAAAPLRRKEAVGATSFVQYALTHEQLRKLVAASNGRTYDVAAQRLVESVAAKELPIPAEQFVRVVHALTEGLLVLHALTPELISPDLIVQAFEALAVRQPALTPATSSAAPGRPAR